RPARPARVGGREKAELEALARGELGIDRLEPWDVPFAVERMRLARYDLDAEALRPYFPMDRVLEGMFEIARRLFGVTVRRVPAEEVWHPEVEMWEMEDESGAAVGRFYTDWFPRESKRAGAWMNGLGVGGPRAARGQRTWGGRRGGARGRCTRAGRRNRCARRAGTCAPTCSGGGGCRGGAARTSPKSGWASPAR